MSHRNLMSFIVFGIILWSSNSYSQEDPHAAVFAESNYPSAIQCASCHPKVFWEWAVSNHAYSSISPMFHKFEQALNSLASGTIGSFCVRCHQQVATQMGEPREKALWERSDISREGVTCITCHRIANEFGKVNGERHVLPSPINAPVYGAGTGNAIEEVLTNADKYEVTVLTDKAAPTNDQWSVIHTKPIEFTQISKSEFCVSCHQVAVHPGIKLEVVWEQYRASPAADAGITCQDCHMGKVPGEPAGYDTWPIAIVNGQTVGDPGAKHSNHLFYGPGYPIAHPGLFPFNPKAIKWSIDDWLKFDYRSPWGEPKWEEKLERGLLEAKFPEEWSSRKDREEARYVISLNYRLLEDKKKSRIEVMENSMHIDGPFFKGKMETGKTLKFSYNIKNKDSGHNLPSGSLGAQPELWFNVALVDPDGITVWETGYVDKYGDMADIHSLEVAAGTIKYDKQLFNLQTKFLTTNVKGTDREMYLPVNFDVDQLPHIRPAGVPTSVINHPPLIRMEGRSLPPLSARKVDYKVPGKLITKTGKYTLQSRFRSRAEPIYFMKFVGATIDMEQSINEWMIDIHPNAVEFEIGNGKKADNDKKSFPGYVLK